MKTKALYLAWFVALFGTVASLFLQEVLQWTPCVLCWYQRIFLYPLVIILAVGIVRKSADLEYYVLPLGIIGGAVAVYHNLLQYKIIPEELFPCSGGVPCTIPYHFQYGFLTVPLLSLISFIVIIICMLVYRKHKYE